MAKHLVLVSHGGDAEGVQERTQDEIEQEILNELYELRRVPGR